MNLSMLWQAISWQQSYQGSTSNPVLSQSLKMIHRRLDFSPHLASSVAHYSTRLKSAPPFRPIAFGFCFFKWLELVRKLLRGLKYCSLWFLRCCQYLMRILVEVFIQLYSSTVGMLTLAVWVAGRLASRIDGLLRVLWRNQLWFFYWRHSSQFATISAHDDSQYLKTRYPRFLYFS